MKNPPTSLPSQTSLNSSPVFEHMETIALENNGPGQRAWPGPGPTLTQNDSHVIGGVAFSLLKQSVLQMSFYSLTMEVYNYLLRHSAPCSELNQWTRAHAFERPVDKRGAPRQWGKWSTSKRCEIKAHSERLSLHSRFHAHFICALQSPHDLLYYLHNGVVGFRSLT